MSQTENIWRQYHDGLRRFIESRVGDSTESDDILQEVFLRIHSRIDTLRDDRKVGSWIYRITRNAIVDYYRSRKETAEVPDSMTAPEADPTERTRGEIQSWLVPMILTLPEPYREALRLSEIEGLAQKELAKRQGISLSGAKSRVQRGRAMLKQTLVDCCRFEFDHRGRVVDWEKKGTDCENC
ncbi:MAG: RNA polymerase sigma factor SigZ [Candidatus Krumholzibacteriia bacterium]